MATGDPLLEGKAGSGASLTALNATQLTFGTVPSARLPVSGVSAASYTNTNLTVDTYGRITAASSGSGGGGVAGANTQIQFNDSGVMGADANLYYLKSQDRFISVGNISSVGQLDGDSATTMIQAQGNFSYSSTPSILYAGYFRAESQVNNTNSIISGLESQVVAEHSTAKSMLIGMEASIEKRAPAATSNQTFALGAVLMSEVTPSTILHGVGVRSYGGDCNNVDPGDYVRQKVAFLSDGNAGWEYPFMARDIDDSTVLFSVDQNGNVYVVGIVDADDYIMHSKYPETTKEAYAVVESIGRELKDNKVTINHKKLHEFVKSVNDKGDIGMSLAGAITAQNEVIKDLIKRIEVLEEAK